MRRPGFTLVELLVVVAIIGMLIALLLPAVQAARESGRRTQCANNMHQLTLAAQNFHGTYQSLPTYNGIFPTAGNKTTQAANPKAVYGSWFVHLMPFVEQQNLYDSIAREVNLYTNTGSVVSAPGGPVLSPAVPAVPAQWVPPPTVVTPGVAATFNQYNAAMANWMATRTLQQVASSNGNGYIIYSSVWVPPEPTKTPDPGTGTAPVLDYSQSQQIPAMPAKPAVYGPPGAPINGYVGIWNPTVRTTVFPILLCPSENTSSAGAYLYSNRDTWGITNYVANWNAMSNGNAALGWTAPPGKFPLITDGLSNTILFGEAFAECEGRGRTAFLAWHKGDGNNNSGGGHNFGLTISRGDFLEIDAGDGLIRVPAKYGYPNPTKNPPPKGLNFLFQIRPNPKATGANGCNSLTGQSNHSVMNMAFCDGSVRGVSPLIEEDVYLRLMQPHDGEAVGNF